jgi:hypothetical protein
MVDARAPGSRPMGGLARNMLSVGNAYFPEKQAAGREILGKADS